MTSTLQNTAISLVIRAGQATGTRHSRIYSTSRVRRLVLIRWAIWHTLRTRHTWTLQAIADEFSTDHANVRHGIFKAASLLGKDSWFTALVIALRD